MSNYFKVNQRTKVVRAYSVGLSDQEYKAVERYKKLGYEIIMLEKEPPAERTPIKKAQLIEYLAGNIDQEIYDEMLERFDKKQNFLRIKSWLIVALQDYADKHKKPYKKLEDIIAEAKEQKNLNEARGEQKATEEKKPKVVGLTTEVS